VIESPGPYERMRRQLVRAVAWLLLVASVLLGIIALGRWCMRQLTTPTDHYEVAFADIECAAPPGMTRGDFLGEVRYLARLPASLTLDAETKDTLQSGFQLHPWVLTVDEIRWRPPDKLRVRLTFRRPALAVVWNEETRVVDDRGVVLPASTPATGLPQFAGVPTAPGAEGKPWPDPEVVRQAQARSP